MRNKNNYVWIALIISSVTCIQAMEEEYTGHRRGFLYKATHPWKITREEKARQILLSQDLFNAINDRDIARVQRVIALGVDVNGLPSEPESSFLGRAIEVASQETVEALIRAGANLEQSYIDPIHEFFFTTPLYHAVELHATPIITLLLRSGADVNHADDDGDSPLYIASMRGDVNSIEILLEYGAEKDRENLLGETPLLVAIRNKRNSVVQALIAAGADVNRADRYGFFPLYMAVSQYNKDIVEMLLRAGADVNAIITDPDPISILSKAYELLRDLEEHSQIVDQANTKIDSLREIIKMLIERGARR